MSVVCEVRMCPCKSSICLISQRRYIYALVDIRTGTPFYIGSTIHPRRRLREHVKDALNNTLPDYSKQNYIRHILQDGLYPQMFIIDVVELDCKIQIERVELAYATFMQDNNIHTTMGIDKRTKIGSIYLYEYIEKDIELYNFLRGCFLA